MRNELSEKEREDQPFIPRHLRRYTHIGAAAGVAVMVIGTFIFKGSDGALQAVWVVGFLTMLVVFHTLDERNKTRERREGKEPQ
jgi:hypothetical protein